MDKTLLGSKTAKGGFANEHDIVAKFNAWQTDRDAQIWLEVMGYDLGKLNKITAFTKRKFSYW